MAVLLASMASTWSMTSRVRSTLVAGGIETTQKSVPVSSSGTSPVFVVDIVAMRATIPTTTAIMAMMGRWVIFVTLLRYLPRILLYDVLNEACILSRKPILRSEPSSFFGLRKMAQSAGDSVSALSAEMKIDTAIVIPNSR